MNRIGFVNEEVPRRSKKFDPHRRRFCKRMALLHTKIAKRYRYNSFCWDAGNNWRCACGKLVVRNWCVRAFVHRDFTWPESFLHQIKYHGESPTKAFFVMVVNVTAKYIPLNKAEKKTVNNYLSGE